jgi:hypothetical protein
MRSIEDLPKTTFSGRRFTRNQLARVQETVRTFSNLSRKELALTVSEHLDWRNPRGELKVNSGIALLEALEEHGVIALPPKRARKKQVRRVPSFAEHPAAPPVECSLAAVTPISLRPVRSPEDRERWKAYIQTYHYLGYKHPFGAHLGYLIVSEPLQQELGCFVFSASAAWALAPRDQWIGWEKKHRERLLSLILSNDRFLLFPWVKVPNLASHVLSVATGQIADDWARVHGYSPVLIETFVDPTRYSGTCYQAANWQCLGQTQGRGRYTLDHECGETKKDIYVYPLRSDWRQRLTETPRKAEIKKRFRNDVASSNKRSVGDDFIAMWEHVVDILHAVAAEYDEKWRVRRRVIDSMMLMLLIFRLVTSKNSQSYGTTIDDLWDSCDRLHLSLPQKSSVAPSSFCAARKKLDASIFLDANQRILQAYASERAKYLWRGHRLFAVDGTQVNLPRELTKCGFSSPNKDAHYPQGLVSCLYEVRSRLPVDFDLVSHANERRCAHKHLESLSKDDVVVYDRGYFSYDLLLHHIKSGVHAVFRLQQSGFPEITSFFSSKDTDKIATITLSKRAQSDIRRKHPGIETVPVTIRLIKYEFAGSTFCLGTTLVEPHQCYPIEDFMDVYHSRWSIEELYKASKHILDVEDFHAKSLIGVKQEIFAHFVLITMNRLLTNAADLELNGNDPLVPPFDSDSGQRTKSSSRFQTNFKHCVHVTQRNLEELIMLSSALRSALLRTFGSIVRQFHKVRTFRSYPRRSLKPVPRWQKQKKQIPIEAIS